MLSSIFCAFLVLGFEVFYAASQEYDYVVVGSGPGGGPLAVDLAKSGNSVLLLEAGSDLLDRNIDIDFSINAVNDPDIRWDFFVKHSDDPERELKYKHMMWRTTNGSLYVGLDPPESAEQLGIWYPRAATLGGGAIHDEAFLELPPDATWDDIAKVTGDKSWGAAEMRKIYEEIENSHYVDKGTEGHGFSGWLETNRGYGSWVGNDRDATAIFQATMAELGAPGNMSVEELRNQLYRDINALDPNRDQATGVFGFVTHTDSARRRFSPANYIRNALAENPELPLFVELNSTLTEIVWDPLSGGGAPSVMAVNYVVGPSAYKADPRYDPARNTTSGFTYVGKELIIAVGTFNSPQILKVSGIGPADELKKHNITVVADVPGVGANLGDIYQGSVISLAKKRYLDVQGSYSVQLKTSVSQSGRDIVLRPARPDVEGFWPDDPTGMGGDPVTFEFALRNPRSSQGTVTLRSADPLEPPEINFRLFEEGEDEDLQAMFEAVTFVENMKARVTNSSGLIPMQEMTPCPFASGPCTSAQIKDTLKTQAYSRHATGTCAIGDTSSDPMAVLDSKFRVKGVNRLRVVDASVFPKPPGAFPILPTFMISRKAAKAILEVAK
ncbi:GMC oxidoreductase [Xylariaceae sp. AK1471]|nr:GMC oxidoreductase [Xylariaceae sp. AK1471]